MARLPISGQDSGTWGNILNDFLSQTLNSDGTLKNNTVSGAHITNSAISDAHIATSAAISQNKISGLQSALAGKVDGGNGITAIVRLTQAEYDALPVKDDDTLYVVVG